MKIVSIDIGTRNLSLCVFDVNNTNNTNNIKGMDDWCVLDLCEPVTIPVKCSQQMQSGKKNNYVMKECTFIAKYKEPNGVNNLCLKHAKCQHNFVLPCKALIRTQLNKKKLGDLVCLAELYKLDTSGPKIALIERLNAYRDAKCLDEIKREKKAPKELPDIARRIAFSFDEIFGDNINSTNNFRIIIENQLDAGMRAIQAMVSQYFITHNTGISVEFISPSNKLKEWSSELVCVPKTSNSAYKERKALGIKKCGEIVGRTHCFNTWINHLETHKKKDDLADAFLQGWWYIHNSIVTN